MLKLTYESLLLFENEQMHPAMLCSLSTESLFNVTTFNSYFKLWSFGQFFSMAKLN